MKDKFGFNHKQLRTKNGPESERSPQPSGLPKNRNQNYLHDHRGRSSFVEYLDDLEE
jgi:hypothetical protein